MEKINVTDITLKKLSEEREVSLLFREKSAIASCADAIGVDAIELPAVKSVRAGGWNRSNTSYGA